MKKNPEKKVLVAVTGATGMVFLESFLKVVEGHPLVLHGICSDAGRRVLQQELGKNIDQLEGIDKWYDVDDIGAPPASGSSGFSSMVILPCTMGTLAAIANGMSMNLIHRAADVILKERRRLVLAVRETPLGRTHIKNMLAAHDSGAIICPPMPSFYLKPRTIEEAAETYSWRLADQLGLEIPGRKRWSC